MSVIFTFFCVIFVTMVLFGGWFIMTIFRLIGRAITGNTGNRMMSSNAKGCANPACRTINPTHANFCRRCGANLVNPQAHAVAMRPPRYDAATGDGRRVAV
jgi:hypothetical protein